VTHDYGFGLVNTAWVAADDGFLARQTGDGLDIVFTDDAEGAKTDLEGVRLAYDGNKDGVLDARDAAYADFGVWQDANGNGVTDAGEFKSLADMGIVSLDLTSDGKSYTAANDQVTVFGEADYTRADGSTGKLGDVAFATRSVEEAQKLAAQSTASSGLTSALVAASLVAATSATLDQQPTIAPASDGQTSVAAIDSGTTVSATDDGQLSAPSGELREMVDEAPADDAGGSTDSHSTGDASAQSGGIDGGDSVVAADQADVPSDLLSGTDTAEHAPSDTTPMFVDMAAIPVAQAAVAEAPAATVDAAHSEQVAAVLADALAGGSDAGPDISALLASLPTADAGTADLITVHADAALDAGAAMAWSPGGGEFAFDLSGLAHDAVTATVHA